jgi:hypothetical protein
VDERSLADALRAEDDDFGFDAVAHGWLVKSGIFAERCKASKAGS